ncbi:uncharacterized protein LOC141607115 [Silene latifolia]|uniref:uncharacterized protein LOC141607115 n=1 Tax=Silene latifolia TaxID=37657 RepID=UPI003D76A4EB
MVFLCETKLSGREMRTVLAKFDCYFDMAVDNVGRSEGLAFWWNKEIKCEFVSSSVHHMDFIIRDENGDWRVTGFYGWPMVADRHLSWELLRVLGRQSTLPWMCIGDYNKILYANEMRRGQGAQWQMNNFREAADECGLVDVRYEGYAFTWDNGQAGDDNNRRSQIARLNEGGRSIEEVLKRRKLVKEVADLCRQEEQFWRQRSRALWLKDEDKNTSFFHKQAGQRKAKNYISKLVDDGSVVRSGDEVVSRVATDYFTELFTASSQRDFHGVFEGMEGRVTEEMNLLLSRNYSEEEVLEALNQMHPLKAPGPDGMNCLFYQTYWHIVGPLGDEYGFGRVEWSTYAKWS